LAIDQYDRGYPGHSLDYAFAAFVPRIIWPEKPMISDLGKEFNVLATNNPNPSSAPGIFADAYWCYGWMGVISAMLLVGALFGALSTFTLWVVDNERWFYFPASVVALRMGLRVDGVLVVDIIGSLAIFLAMCGLDWLSEPVLNAGAAAFRPRSL
jgi:hypothetical protein